ncbi:kinase-like domain-containing protein [Rhizophagus irregularis DAOM 181602=DAOM 197198]|nr:kinase-like domain-containing protein [Rhizophagus irregularis DAOM 181602=DAOM 197198]
MDSDLKNIFSNNNHVDIVDVIVKTIGDPTDPTPKFIRLNLSDNLLSIRKKLEKDCIINDTLSFSKKLDHEFAEIIHEDKFRLYDIIYKIESENILYLKHCSIPNWEYLNTLHKLDYGCIMTFDGIEKPKNRAFVMKNCELINSSMGYIKDSVEFKSIEERIKIINLFFHTNDISVNNFIKLGMSIGSLKNEKLNFESESENPSEEFKQITKEYGQFIPGKVILGGRVLFGKNITSGYLTISNYLKGKSTSYKYNYTKIIGGKQPDNENFDEIAWFKTLKDYRNWEPIEFHNPVSIFQLLPIDLRRRIKCNIFATVIDVREKDFFTYQVLYQSDGEPRLIIHCIQKKFKIRQCKLKIGWMIIGHCTDLSSLLLDSDIQLKVLRNDFASNNQEMTQLLLDYPCDPIPICLGIPVLTNNIKIKFIKSYGYREYKTLPKSSDSMKYAFFDPIYTRLPIVTNFPKYNYTKIVKQQVIERLKLNYGLHLDEQPNDELNISLYHGQSSEQAILIDDGELSISLYNGQPIILYFDLNNSDFSNSTELCINFPIAEITYKGHLSKAFSKYTNDDENLRKLYGHFFARKILIAYNKVKYSIETQFNDLFALNTLPKMEILDKAKLDTYDKLIEWMKILYPQNTLDKELINWINTLFRGEIIDIISYGNLISTSQLRNGTLDSIKNYYNIQIKEKLSLKDWVGKAAYDNLISWIIDFRLFYGLMTNQNYKIEISKEIVISFTEIPKINLSDKSYLKIIKPSTKLEFSLISNFNSILVKCERYEILLDVNNVNPTEEFEQAIEKALESMNPLKELQCIFNEYGQLFPQRIILGRSLKIILPNSSLNNTFEKVNDVDEILKLLDNLNVSYLLTQKGKSVKKENLSQWIDDTKNNLEIIEFDNIIPLYKILKMEQQKKIEDILNKFNDHNRIIMTGITDLKDLDNDNVLHYKCIDLEISLEDKNYEVFGSIISENNVRLDNVYVNFGLYDFNGFYAIIKKSKVSNIDLKECYVSWMIVGKPSQLTVFSPNNRDLQVNYFKESIKLQSNQLNYFIKTSFTLSEEYSIFAHAYDSPANYEPDSIFELVKWSNNSLDFQITNSSQFNLDDGINIGLNICILFTNYKDLKFDNNKEKERLLIGHILTKENFVECFSKPVEDEENK